MGTGLTFVRGRAASDTTETGTTTRVAGQFASPFLSCPVRNASSGRVRLNVSNMITSAQGAVIMYFDPDNANGGGGQPANGRVFDWETDANNRILVNYNKAGTKWQLYRVTAGAGSPLELVDTFAVADAIALYVGWDATNLYIAVDGGAITSLANTNAPALPTTLDIGSEAGASQFEAAYGAVAFFSAPLSAAQWQTLAALRSTRTPCLGEVAGPVMTGLWYGAHAVQWTLPTGSAAIDLNDGDNGDFRLLSVSGAGNAPVLHRAVETPLRDGAAYIDARLRPRMLQITLLLQGVNGWADFWSKRREVLAALNPRRGRGVLMFAPDTQVYEIDAVLESGLEFTNALGPFTQQATVSMRCDDPAWRVAALNELTISSPQSGLSIALAVPLVVQAGTGTAAVQNAGDLPAYPQIRLMMTGSQVVSRPKARSGTTTFTLAADYAPGEVVTIDMDARTAQDAVGASVMGTRATDAQMWALEPGSNDVEVAQNSGAMSARLRWPTRLLGI